MWGDVSEVSFRGSWSRSLAVVFVSLVDECRQSFEWVEEFNKLLSIVSDLWTAGVEEDLCLTADSDNKLLFVEVASIDVFMFVVLASDDKFVFLVAVSEDEFLLLVKGSLEKLTLPSGDSDNGMLLRDESSVDELFLPAVSKDRILFSETVFGGVFFCLRVGSEDKILLSGLLSAVKVSFLGLTSVLFSNSFEWTTATSGCKVWCNGCGWITVLRSNGSSLAWPSVDAVLLLTIWFFSVTISKTAFCLLPVDKSFLRWFSHIFVISLSCAPDKFESISGDKLASVSFDGKIDTLSEGTYTQIVTRR